MNGKLPALPIVPFLLIAGMTFADTDGAGPLPPVHGIHFEMEVSCETCHEGALTSLSGVDRLLPRKDVCADCHDVDDTGECSMCHSGVAPARPLEGKSASAVNFPHAVHVAREMTCAGCHGGTDGAEPSIPSMAACRSCHATVSGLEGCSSCHGEGERLVPGTHDAGWLWYHGAESRFDQSSCDNCHTQSDCQNCHAGDNVRPRSHRLNYEWDHALDARGNEFECSSCHGEPSFCRSCHLENNVLPSDHSRGDWLVPGDGGRHAEEGRFDLESCIACHDTDGSIPVCARCHGEGE